MRGEIVEGLEIVREALLRMYDNGERFFLSGYLATFAESFAHNEPDTAVVLGAIAEDGVIAPTAVFNTLPALTALAEERAVAVDAARARAASMSYDDATAYVFGTIDRLIAEHGRHESAT
jgi:hypothetical protein